MKGVAFLYIKKNNDMRVTNFQGTIQTGEVMVKLNLEIPDEVFNKPLAEASIKVKSATGAVPEITVEASALTDWLKNK
jgi:hypothetical protein